MHDPICIRKMNQLFFNINRQENMLFSLQVRYDPAQGHLRLNSFRVQPECLLRFTLRLMQSVFAGEEHGLHTDDFTSAAQNLNQASKKPASHQNTC